MFGFDALAAIPLGALPVVTSGAITITQSVPEALVQVEQAGVVSLSIAINQSSSASLVIAEQTGNVGVTIPITQLASEGLVLAEQVGVVGLTMPITQSAPDALVIAEQTGVVSLSIPVTQTAPEAIVLAEQSGSVGLSIVVTQATPDALVLTENTGVVSLSTAITITQTASLSLVLTENSGAITANDVLPAQSTGGPDRQSRYAVELDAESEVRDQEDHQAARKKAIEKQRPRPELVTSQSPVSHQVIEAASQYAPEIPVTISNVTAIKPDATLAADVAKLRVALEAAVGELTDQAEALEAQKFQQRRRVALALILAAAA
jgi:hypothetical protein